MKENLPGKRRGSDYLILALKGFCMGAADVIPGVSGGTMAFILGIYEELIKSIRAFDYRFIKRLAALKIKEALDGVPWPFLLFLVLGIMTAIFSLARIISWLLDNKPILIWSFFFGLIIASIISVAKRFNRWRPTIIMWILFGGLGAYWLVGLVPVTTPEAPWFLFLSGAVAICAMILPGISGSFILVLLGKYQYVLNAVNQRDFLTLFIVASGAVVGLVLFSRFLNWLFDNYHDLAIAVLCGLMLGSLRKIWPWKQIETTVDVHGRLAAEQAGNILPSAWTGEVTLALILAAVGVIIVLLLEWTAARQK